MAFEVTCSQCQGRLMVEQAGQVVACPHCGTHLSIPAETSEETPAATEDESASEAAAPTVDSGSHVEAPTASHEVPTLDETEPAPVFPAMEQETQDEIPVFEPAAIDIGSGSEPVSESGTVADSPAEKTAADITAEAVSTAPAETVQPDAPGADHPFANGAPSFGTGFGTAPDTESPFSGGDFNFGETAPEGVATVDEVAPVVVPQADTTESEAAPVEPALESELAEETLEPAVVTSDSPSEPPPEPTLDETATESAVTKESIEETATNPAAATPPPPQPATTAKSTVPRGKYVLVLSWASAATIAALFLAYLQSTAQTSKLESLPDVKPPKKNDEIVYQLVPEEAAMPPGHVLAIGESQRYGNLRVSAERVTRGPIQFEHYDPSSNRTREDGPEVLKLWLKFENVSSTQSIAPLDELVFQRDDRDFENVRSNTFLARASQKAKSGERAMVYDLNTSGDWDLKAQKVGFEIPPGEEIETYIPTTPDGLDQVLGSDEELVWRVHFRKGYSPKNYGVTTVIEVTFTESDIEPDSASPAAASPEADDEKQKA